MPLDLSRFSEALRTVDPDAAEQPTIDQLTLHRVFSYTFTDLQTNGALLILNPLF